MLLSNYLSLCFIQVFKIAGESGKVIPISKILTTNKSPSLPSLPVPQSPSQSSVATIKENGIKLWRIDSFETLMSQVCSLMANYLKHNSTVPTGDRTLCDRIADF